jgi:hypothetical protein
MSRCQSKGYQHSPATFFCHGTFQVCSQLQNAEVVLTRSPKFQNSLGSQNFLRWESENPVVRKSDFHRCHQHKKQSTKVKNMNTCICNYLQGKATCTAYKSEISHSVHFSITALSLHINQGGNMNGNDFWW